MQQNRNHFLIKLCYLACAGQVTLQCRKQKGTAKLVIIIIVSVVGTLLLLAVALLIAVKWKQLLGDFALNRLHRIKRRSVYYAHVQEVAVLRICVTPKRYQVEQLLGGCIASTTGLFP